MAGLILTPADFMYIAVAGFFLTAIVIGINKLLKVPFKPVIFAYQSEDEARVFQKCCQLFQKCSLRFDGTLFKRGTPIRIKTIHRHTIDGKFVGVDNDNVVCLMADCRVVTHDLKSIVGIKEV